MNDGTLDFRRNGRLGVLQIQCQQYHWTQQWHDDGSGQFREEHAGRVCFLFLI